MAKPITYISSGPMAPSLSAEATMAAGKATQRQGEGIQDLGQGGLNISQKIREAEEAKLMSEFLLGIDKKAADFSNSLLTRSDPENWTDDWKAEIDSASSTFNDLNLSPVARDKMKVEFDSWASNRTIRFEGQAALRTVNEGVAMVGVAAQYHIERREFDAARKQASLLKSLGKGDAEIAEVNIEIDRAEGLYEARDEIKANPKSMLGALKDPDYNDPRITSSDREKLISEAEQEIQMREKEEMDTLETKYLRGDLKDSDFENATYVSEKDKLKLKSAIESQKAPTNKEHSESWDHLDNLRSLRDDPAVTEKQYREAWNETRSKVLQSVPPQFQGDLKKELNYLDPSGRRPEGGALNPFDPQDLKAVGRAVISVARKNGDLGKVDGDDRATNETYKVQAKINAVLNQWLETEEGRNASPDQVELKAAELILRASTPTKAKSLKNFVPGQGMSMVPELNETSPTRPGLPGGWGFPDSSLLPPKEQLNKMLERLPK